MNRYEEKEEEEGRMRGLRWRSRTRKCTFTQTCCWVRKSKHLTVLENAAEPVKENVKNRIQKVAVRRANNNLTNVTLNFIARSDDATNFDWEFLAVFQTCDDVSRQPCILLIFLSSSFSILSLSLSFVLNNAYLTCFSQI